MFIQNTEQYIIVNALIRERCDLTCDIRVSKRMAAPTIRPINQTV